jgi:putative phosphoserine phosphatase/1-acylglycerol-3-phosphate O-acyltransferase
VATAAFFDFDGTLIRRESGVICALPSIRRGLLGPAIGAELVGTYLLSKAGLRTRTDAQRVGFRCYAGRSLDDLRAIMQELYDDHVRGYLSAAMRDHVEAHRERGDHLVILTASAFFFAEPIARDLGIEEVIGTQVGFEGGLCTGLVSGEIVDGRVKLAAARAVCERRGVDLASSTFYTDHVADLPLLEAVGAPVAVGPERRLARIARQRGWRIVQHDDAGAKVGP